MTSSEGRPTSSLGGRTVHCRQQNHPQVPQTLAALTISFCHQCQAWTVIVTGHTLYEDDQGDDVLSVDLEFGPFDDVTLVLDEGERILEQWMLRRGRPWDLLPEAARAWKLSHDGNELSHRDEPA